MRRIIFILIALFFISCDPTFHDDFIIVNKCNEDINVSIFYQNGNEQNFIVKSQSEYTFYYSERVGGVSKEEKIGYIFQEITLTKDSVVSKANYADYHLWKKENVEDSKRAMYYTNVKYYLIITPKDFE
jgi:hypothetical protein